MSSGKFATTVGYERLYNPSLQLKDREEFIRHMLADQPPRPANIANIVAINQGRSSLTVSDPVCGELEAARAWERIRGGNLIVDTRPSESFGEGHIPGAFNIQVSSSEFEQRVGWMLPSSEEIVLVAEEGEAAQSAIHKLAFVGLDRRIAGFLQMRAWKKGGLPVESLSQISVGELRRRMKVEGLRVLDVRESSEWRAGHIAGAVHMNFKHLPERLEELSARPDEPLAVICATGLRSSTACSYLLRRGFRTLHNVTGGMSAWREGGHPLAP